MKPTYIGIVILVAVSLVWLVWPDRNERLLSAIPERAESREVHIVAFGDSLTAGFGLEPEESYPAQLERVLQAKGLRVRVTNAGVSGEVTAENLARVEEILALEPDIVLLGIGGNDALRSQPVSSIKATITSTITALEAGASRPVVVLLQMQSPLNAGLSYKQEFDALYEEIADEQELILLPFTTAEIYLTPEYRQSDIIHLTEAGYAAVIEQYLADPVGRLVSILGGYCNKPARHGVSGWFCIC